MIESEIRVLLRSIAVLTRKRYDHHLRELELHIGQELALSFLWLKDGMTQSELRKKIGTEASTVSNMLRKLEADDIIYRKPDELDKRIYKVYLTDKGKRLEEPIMRMLADHEETMLKGITPEELVQMRETLRKMERNMQ